MGGAAQIYLQAALGAAGAAALWVLLARWLARRGLRRWRSVPLGLTLLAAALGYGLFWAAFFSSPAMAVQMHAIRLTIVHALGGALPWLVAGGLAAAALPLLARPR
jgi:hypothetical protein